LETASEQDQNALICEISASSWFYYKEICYDARSHERKKPEIVSFLKNHAIKNHVDLK